MFSSNLNFYFKSDLTRMEGRLNIPQHAFTWKKAGTFVTQKSMIT